VPGIRGVQLDFDLIRERRWARLEGARTDLIEARPGDEITIETVLRPYRGEVVLQQIPIHIPTSTSKGPLRILVSDGETLDRVRRTSPLLGRKMDLASTIALLNNSSVNNRCYVSLLEAESRGDGRRQSHCPLCRSRSMNVNGQYAVALRK